MNNERRALNALNIARDAAGMSPVNRDLRTNTAIEQIRQEFKRALSGEAVASQPVYPEFQVDADEEFLDGFNAGLSYARSRVDDVLTRLLSEESSP